MAVLLFLVGARLGVAGAGIFAVVLLLASPFRFVQLPFVVLYMPLATRYAGAGSGRLEDLHRTAARWSSLLVVPGAAFLAIHAGELIEAIFGEAYVSGVGPLRILLAGIALGSLVGPTHSLLVALRRPDLEVANRVPFAVAVLFGGVWLIPEWKLVGAAAGIFLGDLAVKGASAWQVGRMRRFLPLDLRVVAVLAVYLMAGAGLRWFAGRAGLFDSVSGWSLVVVFWAVGFGLVLTTTGAIGDLRRLRSRA